MANSEIDSIYIRVELDKSLYLSQLQALRAEAEKGVRVTTDESQLTALNRHLDSKIAHLKQVRDFYDRNPIKPSFEIESDEITRTIAGVKKAVESLKLELKIDQSKLQSNIIQSVKSIRVPISLFAQSGSASIDQTQLRTQGQAIGKEINKAIKGNLFSGLFDKTVGSIFAGAFEGFGRDLTKDFSKGINRSIQQGLNESIGSINLVGEKLGGAIVSAIASKIPEELKNELQEDINNVLGEVNILVEKQSFKRVAGRSQERKAKLSDEQINIDRREALRNKREISSRTEQVDASLGANSQAQTRGLAIAKQLREKYAKDPTEDLAQAIKESSDVLEELFAAEDELRKEREKLSVELKQAQKTVESANNNFKLTAKETLPQAYIKALQDIGGTKFDMAKAPRLVSSDSVLAKTGANAAYSAESNSLYVTSQMMQAIRNNSMSQKQYELLYHELQHGKDFDFGSVRGVNAARNNYMLSRPYQATAQELRELSPFLQLYKPEQRAYELNAELAGRRKGGKAFRERLLEASADNSIATYGQDGEKIKVLAQKQFDQIKEMLLSLNKFANENQVSIREEIGAYLAELTTANNNVKAAIAKVADVQAQQVPAESIGEVQQSVTRSLDEFETIQKKIQILKLEAFKKVKELKLGTKISPQAEKVAIEANLSPKTNLKATTAIASNQTANSAIFGTKIVKELEFRPIANMEGFNEEYNRINSQVLPKFKEFFGQIRSLIAQGQLDIVDENEAGALKKVEFLLSSIAKAKKEVEASRESLGIPKIGPPEASRMNQVLAQLQRMQNSVVREITVAKNRLEKRATGNDDDDENLKARLDPLKVPFRSSGNEKKQIEELNKLIEAASDGIDAFDFQFAKLDEALNVSFSKSSKAVNGFFQRLLSGQAQLNNSENLFSSIFNNLDKSLISITALTLLPKLSGQLFEFKNQAIAVASEMKTLRSQALESAGGGAQGKSFVDSVEKNARNLSLDVRQALSRSAGFIAGTEGTSIEGQLGTETFNNFQRMLAARNVSSQKTENFLVGLEQAASKGLQAEELRGQMAEAVPGIIGIFARSQGQTNRQFLNTMRRTTGGLDQSVLFEASQQASAESELLLGSRADSLSAKMANIDNQMLLLQEKAGQIFLPFEKFRVDAIATGLGLLTSQTDNLIRLASTLAIYFNLPLIVTGFRLAAAWVAKASLATKAYIGDLILMNQIQTLGMTRLQAAQFTAAQGFSTLRAGISGFINVAKPLVAIAIGLEAIKGVAESLNIQFSDLSGNVGKFAKNATEANQQLNAPAKAKEQTKFSNNFFQPYVKALEKRDALGKISLFLNPFDNEIERGNKKSFDTILATKTLLAETSKTRINADSGALQDDIKSLEQIDNKLKDIRTQSAAIAQLNAGDTTRLKQLRAEEAGLAEQRASSVLRVGKTQAALEARIRELKETREELKTQAEAGFILDSQYQALSEKINTELELSESQLEKITKAVGKSKTAFQELKREIEGLSAKFEDIKLSIDNQSIARQAQLSLASAKGNLTQGDRTYFGQLESIQTKQQQATAQQQFVNQSSNLFRSPEASRVLRAYNIDSSTGVNKINQIAEGVESENSKFILQQFAQLQQARQELNRTQADIAQAQADFISQLKEQTKQVADYYRGIERESKAARIEVEKATRNIALQNVTTRIRAAIGASDDEFLTKFVDNIIGRIEATNAIAQTALDNRASQLSASNKIEDIVRQGDDLSRSLPGKLEIELDLTNVDQLGQGLQRSQDSTAIINQQIDVLNAGLNSNLITSNGISNSFSQQAQQLGGINATTQQWGSNLQQLPSFTSSITNEFTRVQDVIGGIVSATQQWLSNLAQGGGILGQIAGVANNAINQAGQFIQQTFGGGSAPSTGGFAIASPSTTQSIEQVLRGSVSAAQSFFAPRSRRGGTHYGIDYDSTEGLGPGSNFQSMFPGKVINLRQWGTGAKDRPSGRASNAIRVASELPGGGTFYTDYGHYLVDSAKVQQGQQIGAGQVLGTLSQNDTFSQGGHLDLKIRIPSLIAGQFKSTAPAGGGFHFVDVKEYTRWYQNKIKTLPQQQQQVQSQINQIGGGQRNQGAIAVPNPSINAQAIAGRNNLQSLLVTDTKGNVISQHNANKAPASPASTIKLVLADLVTDRLAPGTNLKVNQSAIAQYEDKLKPGQSTSVGNLLNLMLKDSNNTAFNTLVQALGGVQKANELAKGKGYSGTTIGSLLSIPGGSGGRNITTAVDANRAMLSLINGQNQGDKIAEDALRQTRNFKYSGEAGGKIGNNSRVIGNVGIVNINGSEYLVTAYANVDGNKISNRNLIKNATDEVTRNLFSNNSPKVQSTGITRGGNQLSQAEASRLKPLGKQLAQHVSNPNVMAIADVIARAEGTDFRENSKNFGYTMMVGGKHTTDLSSHAFVNLQGQRSRPLVSFGNGLKTSAFGRYQAMDFNFSNTAAKRQNSTWRSDLSDVFMGDNPGSFSPAVQDLYFVYSLYKRGVLDEVLAGNFQGALSNQNFTNHYASLEQRGARRGAYRGQGTPEGRLANTVSFAQQRVNARRQSATATPISISTTTQLPTATPVQLQRTVQAGTNLAIATANDQQAIADAQAKADRERQNAEYLRKQEQNFKEFRRDQKQSAADRRTSARQMTDTAFSSTKIKSPLEELKMQETRIVREYDDFIREREEKIKQIVERRQSSEQLLQSPDLSPQDRQILQAKLADDKKTQGQLEGEIQRLRKLKAEAIADGRRIFQREDFIRKQNQQFTETDQQIQRLRTQIEGIRSLQQINPLAEEVKQLPDLQRMLELKEVDLELERAKAAIDEEVFNKKLSREDADKQIENLKRINIAKQENIELTYQQSKAEGDYQQKLAELEKRSTLLELDNSLKTEQVKAIELLQQRNPLTQSGEQLAIQRDSQLSQLQLEFEKKRFEIINSRKLTEDERADLLGRELNLRNYREKNINDEFTINSDRNNVSNLETIASRNQKITDFQSRSLIEKLNLKAQREEELGGNPFAINAIKRDSLRLQESIRYDQELKQLDASVAQLRFEGFDITEEQLTSIKEDLAEINQMNLDGINNQAKTFGTTLQSITREAFGGLSQSLTDLILKGGSFTDVLDNLADRLLSGVLNAGFNALFSGLLGGGGGLFGGLFYEGGIVGKMHQEKRMSGRNPRVIIAHEGEGLIPHQQVQRLADSGISMHDILTYSSGGIVGNVPMKKPSGQMNTTQSNTIKVETTTINNQEFVTTDQLKIFGQECVKASGAKSVEIIQNKMQNDLSFRNSVGMR